MSGLCLLHLSEISEGHCELVCRIAERLRHRSFHVVVPPVDCEQGLAATGVGLAGSPIAPRAAVHDTGVRLLVVGDIYALHGARPHDSTIPEAAAHDLLALYLAEGPEAFRMLDGEFVVAVWDPRIGQLIVVNDRFGLYPHWFASWSRGFALAPEIKAILAVPGFRGDVSLTALAEFIRFQQLLGERTWFEQISLLPPASILRYEPATLRLRLERYWDWDRIEHDASIQFEEAVQEATRLFQRAVDRRYGGSRPTGIFLSGGLDSRTILSFVAPRTVTTVTFGAPGCRDVLFAERLARRAGSDHHFFPLTDGSWVLANATLHLDLTEGLHSWIHAHGISVLDAARQMIDVTLSGWDGGTILGGSINFYDDAPFRHPASEEALFDTFYRAFCQDFTWPGLTDAEALGLLDTALGRPIRSAHRETLRTALGATAHYPPDRRSDYLYIQQVLRRSLQNQVVVMRSALDVRCPYFDYALIDFLYSLPEPIRASSRLRRTILTRRAPRLATVPNERDMRLPHTSPWRDQPYAFYQRTRAWLQRHGLPIAPLPTRLYADYEHYLRTDLREWAEDLLLRPRTLMADLVNRAAARALWERHLSGRELWTIGKIAPLMTLELLLRQSRCWSE